MNSDMNSGLSQRKGLSETSGKVAKFSPVASGASPPKPGGTTSGTQLSTHPPSVINPVTVNKNLALDTPLIRTMVFAETTKGNLHPHLELKTDSGHTLDPIIASPGKVANSLDPGTCISNNICVNPERYNNATYSSQCGSVTNSSGSGTSDADLISDVCKGAGQVGLHNPPLPPVQAHTLQVGLDHSDVGKGSQPQFYPNFDTQELARHAQRITSFWPDPTEKAKAAFPQFCELYSKIKSFSTPNAVGARITLDSGLHLNKWEHRLAEYHDNEICAYLRYGWPVGYEGENPPQSVTHNHPSGDNFKSHVSEFINTECKHGAMLGPFKEDPFAPWFRKSPIMSRPKKDSVKRRIIIDLTFPEGAGVNNGINIHSVLGRDISYTLPNIWDLLEHIKTIGSNSWVWVADLQRAYRQLRVDPLDTPLLGLQVDEGIFLDLCPAFGCRSSSAACQRTSNAVVYLMRQAGHMVYAYLDDYAGCSKTQTEALVAYNEFQHLMDQLGLKLAPDKCYPPAKIITWLGYTVNTEVMEVSIPKKKLEEVCELCNAWLNRSKVNKRDLQSFIGKILHIVPCVRHARKFTARMLAVLRAMVNKNWTTIKKDFKADVQWFARYATQANGVSLFAPQVDYVLTIECDACLTGGGGNTDRYYYQWTVNDQFKRTYKAIHQIEAINIVVAFKTFCSTKSIKGKGVHILTDNLSSSYALNSGVTKDPVLAACARQLWLEGAVKDVDITITHKAGDLIPLADALSRVKYDLTKRQFADAEIRARGLSQLPPVLNGYEFFNGSL